MFKVKKRSWQKKTESRADCETTKDTNRRGSEGSASQSSSANSLKKGVLRSSLSHSSQDDHEEGSQSHSYKTGGSGTEDATSSRSRTKATRNRVKFAYVHVREYERVISDNPSCSSGAPIGLGWAHTKERKMEFDAYERVRPRRRESVDLVLTRQDREELLLEWGATFQQIIEAIRSNIKIKNQRRRTVNNLGTYDRWEEAMESASRRIKRTVLMQKPTSKKAEAMIPKVIDNPLPLPIRRGGVTFDGSESVRTIATSSVPRLSTSQTSSIIEEQPSPEEDHLRPVVEVNVAPLAPASVMGETCSFGTYQLDNSPPPSSQGDSNDGFENLQRDDSFWEVQQGMGSPQIRRLATPVVISEDGNYGFTDYDTGFRQRESGFSTNMPPPFSNSIISRWE